MFTVLYARARVVTRWSINKSFPLTPIHVSIISISRKVYIRKIMILAHKIHSLLSYSSSVVQFVIQVYIFNLLKVRFQLLSFNFTIFFLYRRIENKIKYKITTIYSPVNTP